MVDRKRIFIGGTGRSGTTILSKFIGSHSDISKIPFETRFLIDYNGLLNLYDALHRNYSLDQGRIALREFREVMQTHIVDKHKSPYLGHPLWKHKKYIKTRTDELIRQLSEGEFRGADYHSKDGNDSTWLLRLIVRPFNGVLRRVTSRTIGNITNYELFGVQGVKPLEYIIIPKYFLNDQELLTLLHSYVEDIFEEIAERVNGWCEDTPANIYNIEFLHRLFPDAYFLHVMRHPVGVAYSMKRKIWAPSDTEKVCKLLKNLYERSIYCHEWALDHLPNKYRFQRLEDLHDPHGIADLTDFIGLDVSKYNGSVKIDLNRTNYFITKIDTEELNYLQKELAQYIEYFGYSYFKK